MKKKEPTSEDLLSLLKNVLRGLAIQTHTVTVSNQSTILSTHPPFGPNLPPCGLKCDLFPVTVNLQCISLVCQTFSPQLRLPRSEGDAQCKGKLTIIYSV